MSIEQNSALADPVERRLDEADRAAEATGKRYTGEEVFTRVRAIHFTPGMVEKLMEGKKTPLSECVPESEVDW